MLYKNKQTEIRDFAYLLLDMMVLDPDNSLCKMVEEGMIESL